MNIRKTNLKLKVCFLLVFKIFEEIVFIKQGTKQTIPENSFFFFIHYLIHSMQSVLC